MRLALVGGTVYVDADEEPIRDAVVIVDRDRIDRVSTSVDIPADAERLDCTGLTIAAGFWNSHVHFFERKWANAGAIPAVELTRQLNVMLTRYGFTSVFDLGSTFENTRTLRTRIEAGEVDGPRILTTGEGLIPRGAAPPDMVLNLMGVMKTVLPECSTEAEARAAAEKLIAQGADGIKMFVSFPGGALSHEMMKSVVDAAHNARKPVFVHPNSGADVIAAARAGVDVIAHTTPRSGAWDSTLIASMQAANVALTPTLLLWKYFSRHDRISSQEEVTNSAVGQLRDWIAAGGYVLFGSDLGAVDYDPSEEYALMAQAGMSFRAVLGSLTSAPAKRFGFAKAARVAADAPADLVAFEGQSLASVHYTIRRGKVTYRAH